MQEKAPKKTAAFNWEDPFLLEDQLTDDERMIRDTARAYAQEQAAAARDRGLPAGEDRPRDLHRDGRAGPARRHDSREVRLRRRQLRDLRPRRARGRARRQRLPLDE